MPQTANRYSYALNGPYRYTDPSGRFVNLAVANAPLLLSLAIQGTPIVGDAYSALTGLVGYDPIAGISLSAEERALAIGSAAVIGGGFHLLSRLGDGVADASRLGRAAPPPGAGAGGANGGDFVYRALREDEIPDVLAGRGIRRPDGSTHVPRPGPVVCHYIPFDLPRSGGSLALARRGSTTHQAAP